MTGYPAFAALAAMLATAMPASAAGPVSIVAAENFYGDVAQQIGGPDVKVTSILSNPDQDPHLFEASPSVGARRLGGADRRLQRHRLRSLDARSCCGAARSGRPQDDRRRRPVGRKAGDNPHIWYDPPTMLALREGAGRRCSATDDPAHAAGYRQRLRAFRGVDAADPGQDRRAARPPGRHAGRPRPSRSSAICSTRSACTVRNMPFQLAVMNNTEPGASDVAAFEDDLKTHKVKLLVYNSQAADPIADAHGETRQGVARPGRRRDRDRAAGQELPGLDAERTRRGRSGVAGIGPMNAIEFRDVRLALGGRAILDGVSLEIARAASSSACWDRTAPARRR